MVTTTKAFMIMDTPTSKIADVRAMAEKWCAARKYKLVRVWIGVEGSNNVIDQVKVEYERPY